MNRYVLKDLFKQKGVFPFVIMIIMSFLITSLLPYLNGMFIDSLTYKLEEKKIILFAIMIASIGLLGAFLSYYANMCTVKIVNKTTFSLLFKLVDSLEHTQLQVVEQFRSSYITQRIFSDINVVTNFVISNFLTIFLNAFLLLSIIVLFIAINSAFSVFVFLLCITYIVAFAKIKAPLYASSYEKKEADSKIFELINSQIEQIFEIQLNADYYKSKAILNNNFKLYLPKALQVGKFTYLFS